MLLKWVLSDSVVQDTSMLSIQENNSDQAILYNWMFKPNTTIALGKIRVNRDFL